MSSRGNHADLIALAVIVLVCGFGFRGAAPRPDAPFNLRFSNGLPAPSAPAERLAVILTHAAERLADAGERIDCRLASLESVVESRANGRCERIKAAAAVLRVLPIGAVSDDRPGRHLPVRRPGDSWR